DRAVAGDRGGDGAGVGLIEVDAAGADVAVAVAEDDVRDVDGASGGGVAQVGGADVERADGIGILGDTQCAGATSHGDRAPIGNRERPDAAVADVQVLVECPGGAGAAHGDRAGVIVGADGGDVVGGLAAAVDAE